VNNDGVQAMGAMNKQMNLPALSNIMREFDRQNERMEMTSEMMGDAVDDAFEASRVFTAPCLMHSTSNSALALTLTSMHGFKQAYSTVWFCWLLYFAHASGVVSSDVGQSLHDLNLRELQYTVLELGSSICPTDCRMHAQS